MIIVSGIRLHRNISGFPFVPRISSTEAEELSLKIHDLLNLKGYERQEISRMTSLERLKFLDSILTSPMLMENREISSLESRKNSPDIFLMEEDHLVITDSLRGLHLKEMWEKINGIDDFISENLKYAFDGEFGYLTSQPQLLGTGLELGVLMSIPALNYYGMDSLSRSLLRMGFSLDRMEKSGKESKDIFVLTNEKTIGIGEDYLIDKISSLALEIEDMEREKRKKFYMDEIINLEDLVNRSYGILRNARIISEEEMINNFSNIALGIDLSIIKAKDQIDIYELAKTLTDGALQIERGAIIEKKSRDILRANKIRRIMKEVF